MTGTPSDPSASGASSSQEKNPYPLPLVGDEGKKMKEKKDRKGWMKASFDWVEEL